MNPKQTLHKKHFGSACKAVPKDVVSRMKVLRSLDAHDGCVNAMDFTRSGDVLASGSDDCRVILWDPDGGREKGRVKTNHCRNIFSVKFAPWDEKIVISGAMDGTVQKVTVDTPDRSETIFTGRPRDGFVSSIQPLLESPFCFLSTHQSGAVRRHDLRSASTEVIIPEPPMLGVSFFGHLSVTATCAKPSPMQPNLIAVGGNDPEVKLYDLRMPTTPPFLQLCTKQLIKRHEKGLVSGVSGLAWHQNGGEIVANYNGDEVYVYELREAAGCCDLEKMSLDDSDSGGLFSPTKSYSGEGFFKPVKPCEFKGRCNEQTMFKDVTYFQDHKYIVTGGDDGCVYFWERSTGELTRAPRGDFSIVNGVLEHPTCPMLATCGIANDVKLWGQGREVVKLEKDKEQRGAGLFRMDFSSYDTSEEIGEENEEEEEEASSEEDDPHRISRVLLQAEEEIMSSYSDLAASRLIPDTLLPHPPRTPTPPVLSLLQICEALEPLLPSPAPDVAQILLPYPQSESVVKILTCRAHLRLLAEKFDDCVSDCGTVLCVAPGDVKALFLRARAHEGAGNTQAAIADLTTITTSEEEEEEEEDEDTSMESEADFRPSSAVLREKAARLLEEWRQQ